MWTSSRSRARALTRTLSREGGGVRGGLPAGARGVRRGALVALCLGVTLSLCVGRGGLSVGESLDALLAGPWAEGRGALLVWWVRAPQLLTALLVGGALGLSGAATQSLLRNHLADPYLLGVSAGGGLCAALALSFGLDERCGLWALPALSFCGALAASATVYGWARGSRGGGLGGEALVLAGVALNLALSAALTLVISMSGERLGGVWRWLLGRVEGLSWAEVCALAAPVAVGAALLLRARRDLWLLEAGEEVAWTLGVEVERVKRVTLLAVALSVGAAVAFCGVIGFVGLLAPHLVRPRLRGEGGALLPLSALWGAAGLCVCDALGRLTPSPLPIGAVTGLIGGAALLAALRRGARP
jgi:iron complex transport system permease protein